MQHSTGSLFFEAGDDLQVGSRSLLVDFSVTANTLRSVVRAHSLPAAPPALASLSVVGTDSAQITRVTVDGQAVPSAQVSFDAARRLLTVTGLAIDLRRAFTVAWS